MNESLLKHFKKEKIIRNIDHNALKKLKGKYQMTNFMTQYGDYDGMQFVYETSSKKFLTVSLAGGILFEDNFNNCLNKKKSISTEIQKLFKQSDSILDDTSKMNADKSGKSFRNADIFFLNGGIIAVTCTDWSEEMTKKYGWTDNLRVNIRTKKFDDALSNN